MINLGNICQEIYEWIQINVSKLYLDFTSIDDEDDLTTRKISEAGDVINLFFCKNDYYSVL